MFTPSRYIPLNLDPLLKPRSIAIVGATERPSIPRALASSLKNFGYEGGIYPINPKYDELYGHQCFPNLSDLPAPPDVAIFCISRERTQEHFRMLPGSGVGAAVIYGGGYAESGEDGQMLQDELSALCHEAGIALMGPNCMGGISPWNRSATYMTEMTDVSRLCGNVGLISQSGSVTIGLISDLRRFGFSYIISSGNEAAVLSAEYMDYLIDDPKTGVIALFLESVREPERFVAALDRAADAGKPVVALKVGRSDRAQRSIMSHTGSLAGGSEVFSEVLRAHRAIEVRDIEEMTEVLAVCQGSSWPAGPRFAVVTASGGHAELILDTAGVLGVQLPPLSDKVRLDVETVTGNLTGDGNPVDAWGRGEFSVNLAHTLSVLRNSGDYDALGLCMDISEWDPFEHTVVQNAIVQLLDSGGQGDVPHFMMSTRPGGMTANLCRQIGDAGQCVVTGIRPGLFALDKMAWWATANAMARAPQKTGDADTNGAWGNLPERSSINEADAKVLFNEAGLPCVKELMVVSIDDATHKAQTIGYPLVLKAYGDAIPHKTELGLVELGISNEVELQAAWDRLETRRNKLEQPRDVQGYLLQSMISGGVEVFAGVTRDPQFGLTMAFGLGGAAIELLGDFALRLLPLAEGDAETMISEIRGHVLLGPVRGRPAADVAALAHCLYQLSDFVMANEARISEIDLNPIKVLVKGEGCCIVDALIVP